jgi:asparagine synthase (glutamine-hydrolysing)
VYALAKQNNITVLLDGQGADEILAGYPGEHFVPFIKELKGKNKWDQLAAFKKLYKNNTINPAGRLLLKAILPSSLTSLVRSWAKPADTTWLNKDFVHAYQQEQKVEKESSNLNNALYKSVSGGGLETLLRYADRNTMANSVEVRLPFLYHELVHFLFTLPSSFKIHNGWTKWISRYAFDGQLSDEIIWRKEKIGFEPPDKNFKKRSTLLSDIIAANKVIEYFDNSKPSQHTWQKAMVYCMLLNGGMA